jgi:hypothetical protein
MLQTFAASQVLFLFLALHQLLGLTAGACLCDKPV